MTRDTVNKVNIIPFMKSEDGKWIRIRNTDAFQYALNPDTEEKNFIDMKQGVTIVKGYKPGFDVTLTLVKGSPDYELLFKSKFFKMPTGGEAESEAIVLFYQEKGSIKENVTVEEPVMIPDTANDADGTLGLKVQDTNADGTPKTQSVTKEVNTPCYMAHFGTAIITPNTLDSVAGTVAVNVNFSAIKTGGCKIVDKQPVFIEGSWNADMELTAKLNDGTDVEDIL